MTSARRHPGRFLVLLIALLVARWGGLISQPRAAATASGCSAFVNSFPTADSPPICQKGGHATCYECIHSVTRGSGYFLCAEPPDPADGSICVESSTIPAGWGDPDGEGGQVGGDDGGDPGGDGDGGGGDDPGDGGGVGPDPGDGGPGDPDADATHHSTVIPPFSS